MDLVDIVLADPDDTGARAELARDPVAVTAQLGRLLDAGVLEPPILYRHASDEIRRRLVAAVDLGAPDRPLRSYLDALACAGGPIAEAAFRRWRDETPPNVGDGYDFAIDRHGAAA
jgi:hypothetical protein